MNNLITIVIVIGQVPNVEGTIIDLPLIRIGTVKTITVTKKKANIPLKLLFEWHLCKIKKNQWQIYKCPYYFTVVSIIFNLFFLKETGPVGSFVGLSCCLKPQAEEREREREAATDEAPSLTWPNQPSSQFDTTRRRPFSWSLPQIPIHLLLRLPPARLASPTNCLRTTTPPRPKSKIPQSDLSPTTKLISFR